MARSTKKGPYVRDELLKKISRMKAGTKEIIKTWCRACTITPEMVGFIFGVYNGKTHLPVSVTEEMVGHRLGEFSPTTRFSRHGGRIQREIEAKEAEKEATKLKEPGVVAGQPTAVSKPAEGKKKE